MLTLTFNGVTGINSGGSIPMISNGLYAYTASHTVDKVFPVHLFEAHTNASTLYVLARGGKGGIKKV
mgnify:CR=1 FL=1